MTRDECANLADEAITKLKALKRNWPETENIDLLEHCGELLDEIRELVESLDKGLNY